MLQQYLKFFINGGVLGLFSWGLQIGLYRAIDDDSGFAYALSAALTYIPLVVINFLIQRRWIFQHEGLFWRFLMANILIMLSVALLSPLSRMVIGRVVGVEWGNQAGFAIAAVVMSVPSFFLKRFFVFNPNLRSIPG